MLRENFCTAQDVIARDSWRIAGRHSIDWCVHCTVWYSFKYWQWFRVDYCMIKNKAVDPLTYALTVL